MNDIGCGEDERFTRQALPNLLFEQGVSVEAAYRPELHFQSPESRRLAILPRHDLDSWEHSVAALVDQEEYESTVGEHNATTAVRFGHLGCKRKVMAVLRGGSHMKREREGWCHRRREHGGLESTVSRRPPQPVHDELGE